MNSIPKITLDTNCVINLLDFSTKTATSIDPLSEIIRYGLSNKADVAITTRVEADLSNDRNEERKSDMLKKIQMLPIIGTLGRFGTTKWNNGDIYIDDNVQKIWSEIQMIIFPGLSEKENHFVNKRNDLDHLVGHIINKRDIFVTDDSGILKKRESLESSPGIIIMSPVDCVKYLEEVDSKKRRKDFGDVNSKYSSPALKGRVTFDYSNNNGSYFIGSGYYLFETKWSKASDTSIHTYTDAVSIDSLALAKGVSEISEIEDVTIFDYTSRCRSPHEGQIVIFKNTNGIYAAVKVLDIKDDSRLDDRDEIMFEYIIQSDGSVDFSK